MFDHAIYYKAAQSRDKRFDGKFFIGVTTTGIYCRPICPAPCPKPENVQFYQTAAAARDAGFRPCLRCHPESAPNSYEWEGSPLLLSRALRLITDGFLDHASVEDLAQVLNISARHLRRLFVEHLGTNPLAVAKTRRLHLAKKLIHETDLSFSKIAQAAGFSSIRAFNNIIRQTFNKTPTQLRSKTSVKAGKFLTLQMSYRPPYAWEAILAHFNARAIPGLEVVSANAYHRIVQFEDQVGEISVQHVPQKSALLLKISTGLSPYLTHIVSHTRSLFDLEADPMAINKVLSQDPILAESVKNNPGLRVAGAWNEFELALHAIIGQQISLKAAVNILGNLITNFGTPVQSSESLELTHLFPKPVDLIHADLMHIGLTKSRINAVQYMARDLIENGSWRTRFFDLDSAVEVLSAFPGIGPWTAHYIAMRALDFPDAFPAGDLWLRRFFSLNTNQPISKNSLLKRVEQHRPWRAYAAAHLWALTSQENQ